MKKNKLKFRRAVFAVVYSKEHNGKIEYVLLKRKKHWKGWEFPKGKIERFETKRRTAKREVKEETGLDAIKIKRFREKGNYLYPKILKDRPKMNGQTYHLFGIEVEKGRGELKLDPIEHDGYRWADFKEAYEKLTWPNQKKCLKIVNDWLKNESERN